MSRLLKLTWVQDESRYIATHSSVLAWRIPGTGEPGGLPSLGSHRVGHDWSDLAAAAAAIHSEFMELGLDGLRLHNSNLFSHLKPRWPTLSSSFQNKTNKANSQVPHYWEICDEYFSGKKQKLGYFLAWHLSPVWKAFKGKIWLLSEALLHWSLSVEGKLWSVLIDNTKEWWWFKSQRI